MIMSPDDYIAFVMNIYDEKDLLDHRNYRKIRIGIGYILLFTDRYESMEEGFDQAGTLLVDSYSEIDEALDYHIGSKHIVSKLFRKQLEELEQNNCVQINGKYYPYIIRRIYWAMEKVVKGDPSLDIRPFERDGLLTGMNLFHVHHNQTNSLGMNAKRYLYDHYKDYKSFRDIILELKKDRKDPTIRQLLHDFTYVMLMNSLDSSKRNPDWKMTGEWIVFQKLESGVINFLCLATHYEGRGNGEALFMKIRDHLVMSD